jgi:hypothetical protein
LGIGLHIRKNTLSCRKKIKIKASHAPALEALAAKLRFNVVQAVQYLFGRFVRGQACRCIDVVGPCASGEAGGLKKAAYGLHFEARLWQAFEGGAQGDLGASECGRHIAAESD